MELQYTMHKQKHFRPVWIFVKLPVSNRFSQYVCGLLHHVNLSWVQGDQIQMAIMCVRDRREHAQ